MADKGIIETATGMWVAGPLPVDTTVTLALGQSFVDIPTGFPDDVIWDQTTSTFVDAPEILSPLLTLLVAKGYLTTLEAAAVNA